MKQVEEQPGLEELGRDPDGHLSSQPLYSHSGPHRGRRKRERGGRWVAMGGYCLAYPRAEVRGAHGDWIRGLLGLGLRVGCHEYEGARNFYVWKEGAE